MQVTKYNNPLSSVPLHCVLLSLYEGSMGNSIFQIQYLWLKLEVFFPLTFWLQIIVYLCFVRAEAGIGQTLALLKLGLEGKQTLKFHGCLQW